MTVTFEGINLRFDCEGFDTSGDRNQGVADFSFSADGDWLDKYITADAADFSFSATGTWLVAQTIVADPADFNFSAEFDAADFLTEAAKDSWVRWSEIGSADFTIGRSNIAGQMPMDWPGTVYDIRKLRNRVMVYGENGVSVLSPAQNTFGLNTIYTIGLKNKNAVVGNDNTHYFIDNLGQMWEMGEALTKLDYSEYLSTMNSLVMSWDNEKNLIYICDGSTGFVYSPDSQSLASGPVNVAGIRYQDSTSYSTAPARIEIPPFELTTDVYDFGTRKEKTIFGLEISTDLSGLLQASIDYRANYKANLVSLPWHPVTPMGKVSLPCYGVEFRFKFRSLIYEYFEIDWIKINGVIHGFSHLDIQG